VEVLDRTAGGQVVFIGLGGGRSRGAPHGSGKKFAVPEDVFRHKHVLVSTPPASDLHVLEIAEAVEQGRDPLEERRTEERVRKYWHAGTPPAPESREEPSDVTEPAVSEPPVIPETPETPPPDSPSASRGGDGGDPEVAFREAGATLLSSLDRTIVAIEEDLTLYRQEVKALEARLVAYKARREAVAGAVLVALDGPPARDRTVTREKAPPVSRDPPKNRKPQSDFVRDLLAGHRDAGETEFTLAQLTKAFGPAYEMPTAQRARNTISRILVTEMKARRWPFAFRRTSPGTYAFVS